jgi:hypothetical protein
MIFCFQFTSNPEAAIQQLFFFKYLEVVTQRPTLQQDHIRLQAR